MQYTVSVGSQRTAKYQREIFYATIITVYGVIIRTRTTVMQIEASSNAADIPHNKRQFE